MTEQVLNAAESAGPIVVVIAGPNGAGKTTAAQRLLKGELQVVEFLNADLIARGISPFDPEGAAWAASEIMLERMDRLAAKRISFGLETTLAARALAPRIRDLVDLGYTFHLIFLYVATADLAVGRVADRVRAGGHNVPADIIHRRYAAGLKNFFELYRPLATTWQIFDNSRNFDIGLIAAGCHNDVSIVQKVDIWTRIEGGYGQ
jgi:predicted ABC-type ATPase